MAARMAVFAVLTFSRTPRPGFWEDVFTIGYVLGLFGIAMSVAEGFAWLYSRGVERSSPGRVEQYRFWHWRLFRLSLRVTIPMAVIGVILFAIGAALR